LSFHRKGVQIKFGQNYNNFRIIWKKCSLKNAELIIFYGGFIGGIAEKIDFTNILVKLFCLRLLNAPNPYRHIN